MNDFGTLLFLLLLAALAAAWLRLSAARERAVAEARRLCERHGLQLLDETVGLRSLLPRRIEGRLVIERSYGFEVSTDGHDRESGRLAMVGETVTRLSLPIAEAAPPAAQPRRDNVVPLRPHPPVEPRRLH